jgi:formamidopyrimidine-DNA glycosylase
MPELPEVETIARSLKFGGRDGPPVIGETISRVRLLWEKTLAQPGVLEFVSRLKGQRILDVGRRAKYLVLHLTEDALLVHLRMSGDIRVEDAIDSQGIEKPLLLHDRMVLDFSSSLPAGLRFVFNDPRKFGRVWLVRDPEEITGDLGPEPLSEELTSEVFYERLHGVQRRLKPLLLEQTFLAGVGNIYSDEALFLSGIHPLKSSDQVTVEEAGRLLAAIRMVLEEGIRRNGSSIDWVYRGGDFQNHFQVYQRTGQACFRCGTPIERITVGQRGTHFCPVCQPGKKLEN